MNKRMGNSSNNNREEGEMGATVELARTEATRLGERKVGQGDSHSRLDNWG